MVNMNEIQKKLINTLRDMFQFDHAELDFGVYRIMRLKRTEINDFLEKKLPAEITDGLKELAELERTTAAQKRVAEIEKQCAEMGVDVLTTKLAAEYKKLTAELAAGIDVSEVERQIYSCLYEFFSRYYDDGDFISQRRYKDGVYAIPYEGEEIKFHWANADQYYVKTTEYFKDYTFKDEYGRTVIFKLLDAATERDNNKSKEKKVFRLHTDAAFIIDGNTLIIQIEYTAGDKKQAEYIAEIVTAFSAQLKADKALLDFAKLLDKTDGKTALERQLNRYTAKNTFDYFIHKDLEGFLNRELDYFIKSDVFYIDDVDEQSFGHTRAYITKAKVLRKIAKKIIKFLAQIENFQKKLYLKKKFIVETNYCITLDRIPESFYAEVAANTKQREEWVKLFAIDGIKGDKSTAGYSVPLSIDFLRHNPFLVLDTAFFNADFKERLIASIDNLDEHLDGLLIHGDNFHGLRLLFEKYKDAIDCVYGDPPYNAKSSEILYKNSYKHSSWISFMFDRVKQAAALKAERGAVIIAIDENEAFNLIKLLDTAFPNLTKTVVAILHNPAGVQGDNFSYSHEYAVFMFQNLKHVIGKTDRDKKSTEPFRDWGPTGKRNPEGLTFYPILVDLDGETIIGFGDACESSYHPKKQNIRKDDCIEVYPVGDDGDERKWVFARDTVEDIMEDLFVVNNDGIFQIMRTKSKGSYKTVWHNKRYYANIYGSKVLNDIMGSKKFDFPKSIYTIEDCISTVNSTQKKPAIILDYFAGSGTTAHAVINLNRDDDRKHKYILIEMGEYFDTVTKPRVQKVIYSDKWKKGKPATRKGSSHAFKYIRLESYEDVLNNIVLGDGQMDLRGTLGEQCFLSYMLNNEADGASLLQIDKLSKPFEYALNIKRNNESKPTVVDLPETFNYLIGLTVTKSHARQDYTAAFATGKYGAEAAALSAGTGFTLKAIEGTLPNGDTALVIWRTLSNDVQKDNAVLDACIKANFTGKYKKIFINGDNAVDGAILIEDEMKRRMFERCE